jgi:group I intron endonuclease
MLNNKNHHSILLQRAWNKYGKNSFVFEIIENCIPEVCLCREQFYIDTLKPEYNVCMTAGSPLGRKVSDETKRKISLHNAGENNPFYGKHHTNESKQKMSKSLKGKLKGVMINEKNPMYKKTHTDENKLLMSKKSIEFWTSDDGKLLKQSLSLKLKGKHNNFALKGKNHPNYNPTIYTFVNNISNEQFNGTVLDFRKKYNLCGDIYYLINGKYKQYKGWILNENV